MAENSKIEWTDHTFNAWTGCTKVSPACDFCYAESWAKRSGIVQWGNHPRRRTSESYWKQPLKWDRIAKQDGVRRKVFCCSLADVFDNQVDPQWRDDLWRLIASTQHLDWLLLTKRPQNIAKMLPRAYGFEWLDWPYQNVWLGTTVENQEEADRRIPHLLAVPAKVRFLSCEPLLGRVDLTDIHWGADHIRFPASDDISDGRSALHLINGSRIDWVITGGESGPGARPSNPQWFRDIGKQCADAGVPWFHKQNGEHVFLSEREITLGLYADEVDAMLKRHQHFGAPDGADIIYRVGKKAAGALLDGVAHRGMPPLPEPSDD